MMRQGFVIVGLMLYGACSACGAHSNESVNSETNMAAKGNVPPGTGGAGTPPPNIAPKTVKVLFKVEPAEAAAKAKITMYGRPVAVPQDFVAGMGSVVKVTAEGYQDFEGTFAPAENTTITITLKKK